MMSVFKGQWVLITGGSEGLGREFASQLAARGMNIIIVGRDQYKLQTVAEVLANQFSVSLMPIALDLSVPGSSETLFSIVSKSEISLCGLINNAADTAWGEFNNLTLDRIGKLLRLNTAVPSELISIFVKTCRPKSFIVNVASVAAWQPLPYFALYGASKSFLMSLSLALFEECREKGIYVQTLLPSALDTDFDRKAGIPEFNIRTISVKTAVHQSLQAFVARPPVVEVGRNILLQKCFALFAPWAYLLKTVGKMFKGSAN